MTRSKLNTYRVYMHRNKINGKVYIGCTKKPLSQRYDNGNGYKKCTRFWSDICLFGFDAFEHILLQDDLSEDEAKTLEEKLVDAFDAMNPDRGYNMRKGGKSNTPCKEVGRHISEAKMGHPVSKDTREKLSKYGRKRVVQLDKEGNIIAVHESLTEAAETVGAFKSNIYAVCAGKKPTSRGFRWAYFKEVIA